MEKRIAYKTRTLLQPSTALSRNALFENIFIRRQSAHDVYDDFNVHSINVITPRGETLLTSRCTFVCFFFFSRQPSDYEKKHFRHASCVCCVCREPAYCYYYTRDISTACKWRLEFQVKYRRRRRRKSHRERK